MSGQAPTIICPVCRASNPLTAVCCRRCKADLSLLGRLESQRAAALDHARRAVLAGDAATAWRFSQLARRLRDGADARQVAAAAALLAGHFAAALHLAQQIHPPGHAG